MRFATTVQEGRAQLGVVDGANWVWLGTVATGLRIQSRLNGQVMQDANTSDTIKVEIEKIGVLMNPVVAEAA